jgi:hypothetical protein
MTNELEGGSANYFPLFLYVAGTIKERFPARSYRNAIRDANFNVDIF